MRNFFLKLLLRLQSAIHLMKIESTAVEIFAKEKAAIFEPVFSKTMQLKRKNDHDMKRQQRTYISYTPLCHFMPEIANFCARNP